MSNLTSVFPSRRVMTLAAGMIPALCALSCSTDQGSSSVVPGADVNQTAGLGDRVWDDLDDDGIQDVGEPGIEGVRITLSDQDGLELDQIASACDGSYAFSGLVEGTYRVRAQTPDGFVPAQCNAGGDESVDSDCGIVEVVLSSGAVDATVDFGFRALESATIGDLVWHDLDANGAFDEGEPGLVGVEVILRDGGGAELERTTTGPDGLFTFGGLADGEYLVEADLATLAPWFSPTPCNPLDDASPGEPFDSNCSPATVSLSSDVRDPTVDFGFFSPFSGTIGDLVWHDANGDGLQGATEPGLEGVHVLLLDDRSNIVARTTSGARGSYRFTGLPIGAYSVEVDLATLPPQFTPSTCKVGGNDTSDSDCIPATVILLTNTSQVAKVDFGFQSPFDGAIGDRVWNDEDGDGLQDAGETGIEGVRIRLTDEQCGVVYETSSGPGGFYRFAGLGAGGYTVSVASSSVPEPFAPTPCNAGSNDEIDNDCGPVSVLLPTDFAVDGTIDFGFRSPFSGTIGDTVFLDVNANGLQDDSGGASLLAGLRFVSRNRLGLRSGVAATVVTNGSYRVAGLAPGQEYRVAFDTGSVPTGLVPTLSDVGADDTLDSDASPARVALAADEENVEDLDFGFVQVEKSCRVLDFETDDNGVVLVNGQDISTPPEFGNLVAILSSGDNLGAAIFDSSPGGPNARGPDPDLLVDLGNLLILQGAPGQSVPGIFDEPDDAPGGGKLIFLLTEPSEPLRIDLVDIAIDDPLQGARVILLDENGNKRIYHVPGGWTGDLVRDGAPGYGTLDLTTLAPQPGLAATATAEERSGFDPTRVVAMEVRLFGSGAVDNFELCR